jgi:hypothetical protein
MFENLYSLPWVPDNISSIINCSALLIYLNEWIESFQNIMIYSYDNMYFEDIKNNHMIIIK